MSEFVIGVIGRGEWSKETLSRIGIRIAGGDIEDMVEQTEQTEKSLQKTLHLVREYLASSGLQIDMPIIIRPMQLKGFMLDGMDIFSVKFDSDVSDIFGIQTNNPFDIIAQQFNSAYMKNFGFDMGPSQESRPSDRKNPRGSRKSKLKRPPLKINSKGFRR